MDARQSDTRREKPVRHGRGPLARSLGCITALVVAVLFAVAVSAVIECLGIAVGWWPADHARTLLITERTYIEALDQYPLTALSPQAVADQASRELDSAWRSLFSPSHVGPYTHAVIHAVKLVLLRTSICLFVLPGFALIALAAFCDGLVARDIRKYTGGHESSYVFHKAKRWIVPSLLLTISLYLMMPFSVPPAVIFAPSMALTGVMMYVATSRFKKFL